MFSIYHLLLGNVLFHVCRKNRSAVAVFNSLDSMPSIIIIILCGGNIDFKKHDFIYYHPFY
jgi:hypothetical protein